jgi:hypothetical protein
MPGLYMGIIHIDVMREIKTIIKLNLKNYEITAPDVFLTFISLLYQKKDFSLFWNKPLFVRGTSGDSNGARIHTNNVYKPIPGNSINDHSVLSLNGNTYVSHILTIWFEYIQAMKFLVSNVNNIYTSNIKIKLSLAVTFDLSRKIQNISSYKIYQILRLPFKENLNIFHFYFLYYKYVSGWLYVRIFYHITTLYFSKNKIRYLIFRFLKNKKYNSIDDFIKSLNFEK